MHTLSRPLATERRHWPARGTRRPHCFAFTLVALATLASGAAQQQPESNEGASPGQPIPEVVTAAAQAGPEEDSASAAVVEAQQDVADPEPNESSRARLPRPEDSLAAAWVDRIEQLSQDLLVGRQTLEDADRQYEELALILRERVRILDQTLDSADSPSDAAAMPQGDPPRTVEQLHVSLLSLYETRVRLLDLVSPELRGAVLGTELRGVRALQQEVNGVVQHVRFLNLSLPTSAERMGERLLLAPIPTLINFFKLFVVWLLLRAWRRWAPAGLPAARRRLGALRPQRGIYERVSTFLWYFNRVRQPIEWQIMIGAIFRYVALPEFPQQKEVALIVLRFLLSTWFAVRLIDAFAVRFGRFESEEVAAVRLRSLRLLAVWVLLLLLGTRIAELLAGKAALHAWVWVVFKALAIPVVVLLLRWWRSYVLERLESELGSTPWLEAVRTRSQPMRRLLDTTVGVGRLALLQISRTTIRSLSSVEGGRRLVAGVMRRDIARQSAQLETVGQPLPDDRRIALREPTTTLVEGVGTRLLAQIGDATAGSGLPLALVGERGSGKTTTLRRALDKLEAPSLFLECPYGDFEALRSALAHELGMAPGSLDSRAFGERASELGLRAIAIDNAHRLSRPIVGGQQDLDRAATFLRDSRAGLTLLSSFDSASWQYLSRLRENRNIGTPLMVPPWTEKQIARLIEIKCDELGLELDFSHLMLPRRFDEVEYSSPEERHRVGFYRMLWFSSDGNPKVAQRLWARSLLVSEEGRLVVRFPDEPDPAELEAVTLPHLLVLRYIAQCEAATADEIAAGLRMDIEEVSNSLFLSQRRGWVEPCEARYRISGIWFRTITRVLSRKNLLLSNRQSMLALANREDETRAEETPGEAA
jgi:hypothetical protein